MTPTGNFPWCFVVVASITGGYFAILSAAATYRPVQNMLKHTHTTHKLYAGRCKHTPKYIVIVLTLSSMDLQAAHWPCFLHWTSTLGTPVQVVYTPQQPLARWRNHCRWTTNDQGSASPPFQQVWMTQTHSAKPQSPFYWPLNSITGIYLSILTCNNYLINSQFAKHL